MILHGSNEASGALSLTFLVEEGRSTFGGVV